MGRVSRRWWVTVTLLVWAMSVLPPVVVAAAAGTDRGSGHTSASKLVRLGHATFWDCPAKTTDLLVAVNTLTLHPGTSLDISFTVRNAGTSSCKYTAPYAGITPGPTTTALTAGPCGSVGYEIVDSHHHDVWPGVQVVNCPALGFAQLAPDATVSGTGSWNQTKPDSTHRVPVGKYTLVVENKRFNFPLRVTTS